MYDADNERVWSFQPPAGGNARFDRYTLRDLDGKVKRTFEVTGYNWANSWTGTNLWEDLVYRDRVPLAGFYNSGVQRQMDLDHLGSPRVLTAAGGGLAAYHVYLPYGVEATGPSQDAERLKFTGHERDLADLASPADDLDYMHARFTNPITGRFLTIDPMALDPDLPQGANRYAYVRGNPISLVDRRGLEPCATDGCITVTTTAIPNDTTAADTLAAGGLFFRNLSTGFGLLDVRQARFVLQCQHRPLRRRGEQLHGLPELVSPPVRTR